MATSGRRHTLALICLALAGTFGCSPAPGGSEAAPSKTARTTTTSAPADGRAGDFCEVARPDTWVTAEKSRQYPSRPGLDRRGTMVSADGDTLFAIDTENGRSELVYLKGKGQEKHVIHALDTADAGRKVQYGSSQFDGRWLLFDVAFDAENWNDWALYAWDSTAAAAPFLVTRHDKSVPGPFLFTHLRDGKAAWAEGIPDGRKAVHLYDLAGRADSVVRTGHTSPVFVAGDLLGWREAPGPREPVLVKAVSLRTGQPVALPPVIAKIRGTAHVAGDGRIWTWVSPDYTTLYAWQPGWEDSATIARAKEGEHIDQMQLAGDLVTWVGGEAVWAADIRSHSRTTLTPQYGSVASNGDSLLVTYLTGGYSKDPAKQQGTTSYVLRAPDLEPLPTCAKWVPVPQPLDETGTLDPDPGEGA